MFVNGLVMSEVNELLTRKKSVNCRCVISFHPYSTKLRLLHYDWLSAGNFARGCRIEANHRAGGGASCRSKENDGT